MHIAVVFLVCSLTNLISQQWLQIICAWLYHKHIKYKIMKKIRFVWPNSALMGCVTRLVSYTINARFVTRALTDQSYFTAVFSDHRVIVHAYIKFKQNNWQKKGLSIIRNCSFIMVWGQQTCRVKRFWTPFFVEPIILDCSWGRSNIYSYASQNYLLVTIYLLKTLQPFIFPHLYAIVFPS